MKILLYPFLIIIFCILNSCHSRSSNLDLSIGIEFIDTVAFLPNLTQEHPKDSFDFRFVNKRDYPVVVLRAVTSCECTTSYYEPIPVQPGDTGFVRVKYDGTGRTPEYFNKSCLVSSSASNHDQLLWIQGELK